MNWVIDSLYLFAADYKSRNKFWEFHLSGLNLSVLYLQDCVCTHTDLGDTIFVTRERMRLLQKFEMDESNTETFQ